MESEKLTEEQIKDAHKALMAELFLICQPGNGEVFSFMDDHPEALRPALAAALRSRQPATEELVEAVWKKVWMTVNVTRHQIRAILEAAHHALS
jgi:hypothetical protein